MKYTKYNHKKKNEGAKFLASILLTTVLAISIGGAGAWAIIKFLPKSLNVDTEPIVNTDTNINSETETNQSSNVINFAFIQCGYFSKEDNANQILASIEGDFNSFKYQDETGKFKVIAAITKEENSEEVLNILKGKEVESAKLTVSLNGENSDESQIAAIVNGHLEIINAAYKTEVKEVTTADFKSWANGLDQITEGKYLDLLNEYKNHINNMPEKIDKENMKSELQYLYSVLDKIEK